MRKIISRAALAAAVLAFTSVAATAPASANDRLKLVCVKILGQKICVKI